MGNAKRTRATLKASDKTLEPAPAISLNPKERKEVAQARAEAIKADTQAALQRPSQLTPLQLKRLAYSEAKKAALKAKREAKDLPPSN